MGIKNDYDFSGWATKNDIRCVDGRTIRQDAFKECDGKTVPIVWSHMHNDPDLVLGHALLENHPEGVRMYGKLNDSPKGRQTKLLIEHGDVVGLSIWANQLQQNAGDVLHGVIREVSVVLAGANPGAFIDSVTLAHSEDGETESESEAIITTGEPIELFHAAPEEAPEETKEVPKKEKEMADEKEKEPKEVKEDDNETVGDVFNTLSEKQKTAVYAIIAEALKDEGADEDEDDEDEEETDEDEEDSEEDKKEMKHNVFDVEKNDSHVLSHDDMKLILSDAKRLGSMREAVEHHMEDGVLAHAVYNTNADGTQGAEQTYGMADINWLFPEARRLDSGAPEFIKRNDEWVNVVISGTHHTPFSRIKSVFANITNEEARARGYVKGNRKVEEVFSLLKRSTDPQTIYKKQKMDRDDIIDITDFDVVAWLKGEMRMMLNEEIARAILIGDGRLNSDDDKIKEDHVRPIITDDALYNITATVEGGTPEQIAKNLIKASIRARKDYKGSGSPILFTGESMLTELMLLEDGLGHPLYADEAALARRMRVNRIVTCPLMDTATVDGKALYGVIVNLTDYNIGADKGGEINMFDDFDIDFNQQKYLIETRISGALTRPYSAITLVAAESATSGSSAG